MNEQDIGSTLTEGLRFDPGIDRRAAHGQADGSAFREAMIVTKRGGITVTTLQRIAKDRLAYH
jgi:hypothetical protein